MWLQYFGFQVEPFGVSPDPRCLYLSRTHREALAELESGFSSNRGFTAMIAPPGMGKTTLLFRFLEGVRKSTRCVFLFDIDAECEPRDLVIYILRELGITPARSSAEMHGQLSNALIKETQAGRKFVVVIDEAQNLSDAVLERVRLLTNFETSQGKLMHVVLSGQPQLADKLLQPSMVQLRQRISTICRIEPLAAEDILNYINYRVKLAGYSGAPLFTEAALESIAEASNGTPRTINNLCYKALSLCCALKSKQVDGSMVSKVIASLQLSPQSGVPIAAKGDVGAIKPRERKPWFQTRRLSMLLGPASAGDVMLWVPAAMLLLVMWKPGMLHLDAFRASQSLKAGDVPSLNLNAAPAQVPAPATIKAADNISTAPTSPATSFVPESALIRRASAPASAPAAQFVAPVQTQSPIFGSIPKPSTAAIQFAAPLDEPLPVYGSIPKPSVAAQPAVTLLQPSAPVHSPSSTPGADVVTAKQSLTRVEQHGSQVGAPSRAPAPQVRPALAGNTPVAGQTATALSVRPALPQR